MSVLAIPDDFIYKLRKDIRKTRPLTKDEIQELQGLLDQAVHDFVGLEPKIGEWGACRCRAEIRLGFGYLLGDGSVRLRIV